MNGEIPAENVTGVGDDEPLPSEKMGTLPGKTPDPMEQAAKNTKRQQDAGVSNSDFLLGRFG